MSTLHKSVLIRRNRYATSRRHRRRRRVVATAANREDDPYVNKTKKMRQRSMSRRVHVADRCTDYRVRDRGGQLFDNLCFLFVSLSQETRRSKKNIKMTLF